MSLINEALKRAKQAQAQAATTVAVAETPLQPAVHSTPNPARSTWIIASAAFAILLLSVWCLALWWRGSVLPSQSLLSPGAVVHRAALTSPERTAANHPSVTPTATSPAAATNQPAIVLPVPALATPAVPVPAPVLASVVNPAIKSEPTPASERKTNEPAFQPVVVDSPMPEMKVQGIFFRGSNSSAFINGQTVFVGDEVEGAKVVAIERQSVRLLWGSKTNVAKLH